MRKDCGTCHFEKNLLEEEPCNRCDDNNSEWKSGKIYFAIAELEKIKDEIDKADSQYFYGFYVKKPEVLQIIDNHIKELNK